MLTSNNYLGFANHPRIVEAAQKALERWGNGLGSVRFICGTQELHKELERTISAFFGTEDTILYMSCWNANEGLFQPLLGEEDAHPDRRPQPRLDHRRHPPLQGEAVRPRPARRPRRASRRRSRRRRPQRRRLFMTDGVFSMEGEVGADSASSSTSARSTTRLLVVDDSHATGVLGSDGPRLGRGARRHGKVAVFTSTLGKAMGSAAGGFTTGPAPLVDLLRQRSRTTLFSNALPPAVTASSLEAFRMLMEDPAPARAGVHENATHFRARMKEAGFNIPEGVHPIVPVIVGDTAKALAMSAALFEKGVYVSGFGFPVVPQGHARLRCQISAVHSNADLRRGRRRVRRRREGVRGRLSLTARPRRGSGPARSGRRTRSAADRRARPP